ncbi:MAG TPA: flagellar basal body P-ring formation chaperone FlgA [Syntrophorhabdus sp.]|nr:flagellar basal body P-ring formation chaperone FlgA [Syntrophorhabdus sp.]
MLIFLLDGANKIITRFILPLCILVMIVSSGAYAGLQDQSFIETKISDFIRKIYGEDDSVQIKFVNIPAILKGKPDVKNISFVKAPDAKGDGVCLVGIIDARTKRDRNVYVPFRTVRKTKIYVLNHSGKRGDVIRAESVTARETLFNEKKAAYPSSLDDIIGRTLRKDVAKGTVISYSIIDDPVVIRKGELIDIIAENKNLYVRAKGKALEKGRMGDSIRVKNMSSDREIVGKVVSGNKILVSFR